MSTAAHLLAAVIAEPDEDTPRLVFADYLEENDQPERAELIRAQCESARLPNWDLRAKHLRHRVRVLLARHSAAWRAELPNLDGVEWGAFDRGFVAAVRVPSGAALGANAGAIRAAAPVERVEFSGANLADAGVPLPFPWVRSIRLHDRYEFNADRFEALLNSGISENLRVLDLSGVGVENAGAEVIARTKHLTTLEELDLSNCFVGVQGVAALAGAAHLANLRIIRFSSYGSGYVEDPFLHSEGVALLAAAESKLRNLTTLELGQNELSDEAVRSLLTSPALRNLEELSLRHCEITPEALAAVPGPARLKSLDISGLRPGPASVRALATLPQFQSLVRLRADGSDIGAEVVSALAGAGFAHELRELYLSDNDLGTEGATALAGGDWPNLHTLDLRRNRITSAGARYVSLGRFPALADLRLDHNEIGDAGLKAIGSASWAGSLRRLRVEENKLGPDGAVALAASPKLHNLTQLGLANNQLGPVGVAALARGPWAELTDLALTGTGAGDDGVRAIAAAGFAANLVSLLLDNNDLSADAVRALAAADCAALRDLALGSNSRLGAAGAEALAGSGRFPALVSLGLMYCNLDAASMEAFAKSELVARLRRLQVYGNKTTQELHKQLGRLNWGDLGPDWIEEDAVAEEDW